MLHGENNETESKSRTLSLYEDRKADYDLLVNSKTALVRDYKPKSKLEKMPPDLLQKIISFISNKDRGSVVLVSSTMRKAVRATPSDLRYISLVYTDLVMFLTNNLDLNVSGLTVHLTPENSPNNLTQLRRVLAGLNYLTIYCFKEKDLSALLLCTKLYRLCVTKSSFVKYIGQCMELRSLTIQDVEDSDIVMNFPELENLHIGASSISSLDISSCSELNRLHVNNSTLKTINPPSNISNIKLSNNKDLDMSFLAECPALNKLDIYDSSFDVCYLTKLHQLDYMRINVKNILGDFEKLSSLTELHIVSRNSFKGSDSIPPLPPNLKSFKLQIYTESSLLNIKALSKCPNLGVLEISSTNTTAIDLEDISVCNMLERIKISCKFLHNDKYLEKFPLVTLSLRCFNDTFETKFSNCPSLKYFHLSSRITSLDLIKNCSQFKDLFVCGNFRSIKEITTCSNVVKLGIGTDKKINYEPLLGLKNLTDLYTITDLISKPVKNEIEKRDIRISGYSVFGPADNLKKPIPE